jgi:pyrroline-5-carboxylate reductase
MMRREGNAMREIRLGLIGAGNMGEAIVRGILGAGVLQADEILAADPDANRRKLFEDDLGIHTFVESGPVVEQAPVILLAVKPQMFDKALVPVASLLGPDSLLISICAGISTRHIEAMAATGTRVVRAMSNTPIVVGRGIVALSGGTNATEEDLGTAEQTLGAAAEILRVPETLIDAVTAVSGSGPAYFFYLVELLAAAGVKVGLSEEDAERLARVTFEGAARLLAESGEEPEALRAKVTSPGGTTEAAIRTFDALGFPKMVAEAVKAARDRGRELGR